MIVSRVRVTWAPASVRKSGLLAWLEVVLDDALKLDGLALRRTRDGRRIVSFPSRRDRHGNERAYVAPLGDAAREAIQHQILDALDLNARVTP